MPIAAEKAAKRIVVSKLTGMKAGQLKKGLPLITIVVVAILGAFAAWSLPDDDVRVDRSADR